MQFYKKVVNGKEIQIADYPGEKGPIIAIHGLTGTHKNMHYFAGKLEGKYRFIAVDLRGRGNSDRTDNKTSIFKHAQDILELIEQLNIKHPILLGHSMGAFISTIVANELNSVKAVILLDGAAKVSNHQREIVKPSLGRLSKKYRSKEQYVKETYQIYSNLGITWNETLKNTIEYEVQPINDNWENKSDELKVLADFESFYRFDVKEVCSKIVCPVLLVYAKSDIGSMPPLFYLKDYEATQAYIENIKTVISDCNHYTMVFENREDINYEIKKFLDNNDL